MLYKRIVSAIIAIMLLIVVVLADKVFINIAIAILSVIALYEFFNAIDFLRKKTPLVIASYLSAITIVLCSSYIQPHYLMPLIWIFITVLFLISLIFSSDIKFNDIAITFFITIYISYFLSHIILTRSLPKGEVLVWLIFLGGWLTDTFAFFTGISLGKTKLYPSISPKKTIEGAIGGILGCSLGFLLYGYLMSILWNYNVNYLNLFILGLICSLASQTGDLSASFIKRQYNIKDFGDIMPGHGGALDRFDSILFVAPLVYYFLLKFNVMF